MQRGGRKASFLRGFTCECVAFAEASFNDKIAKVGSGGARVAADLEALYGEIWGFKRLVP